MGSRDKAKAGASLCFIYMCTHSWSVAMVECGEKNIHLDSITVAIAVGHAGMARHTYCSHTFIGTNSFRFIGV